MHSEDRDRLAEDKQDTDDRVVLTSDSGSNSCSSNRNADYDRCIGGLVANPIY
jgi:hypothetical protein